MLELSATLKLRAVQTEEAWQLNVTTQNVGPGHAIPTGDPSRHLVLEVDGECDGTELMPKGGDTIPIMVVIAVYLRHPRIYRRRTSFQSEQ